MDKITKEFHQWEDIIIQWINCLELTNPITDLEEIRNGEFFTALFNDLQGLSEKKENILSKLYHFLKLKYPAVYCSRKVELITKISLEELLITCTVLMHYTCIHDRRDKYISPLCARLSERTQSLIKAFLLEEFASFAEIVELIKVIIKKNGEPRTPKTQLLNSGGDSVQNSPLKDFLETPPLRLGMVVEKDRKIKCLMQELQSERFEKEDMILELKEKEEQINKLNKQIAEKSLKITQLHDEINNVDFKKTPHKLKQFEESERRLKVELMESQNYIAQLHQEQESANNNIDLLLKKLEAAEKQVCLWDSKSLDLETKHEELLKNYKLQEMELNNLRTNYSELKTLLDELRSSNNTNESISEVDKICQETLASSVIEIQMHELQEENSELKDTIKDLNNNFDHLQKESQLLKSHVIELEESKSDLECRNNNILIEVNELKTENSNQKNELQIIISSLSDARATLKDRDEIISLQKNEIKNTKDMLKERDEIIASLKTEINITKSECEGLSTKLSEKEELHAKLNEEVNYYEKLYNDVVMQMCSEQASFVKLDEQFEQNLIQLEKLLTNQNQMVLKNRNESFRILLGVFKDDLSFKENEKLDLLKVNQDLKNLVTSLQNEIDSLNNKLEMSYDDVKNTKEKLAEANKISANLENVVKLQEEKIEEKNNMIQSQVLTIKCLEELIESLKGDNSRFKTEITLKTDEIAKNIILCNTAKAELEEEINKNKSLEDNIQELKSVNETLAKTLQEYKEEIEKIQGEGLQKQFQDTEQINMLNEKILTYQDQLEKLETELNIAENKFEENNIKLQELSDAKKAAADKFESETNALCHKQELLETAIVTLTEQYEEVKVEKDDVKMRLQEQVEAYKELKYEENECKIQCQELQKQLMELKEKLVVEENKCAEINEVSTQSARDLVAAKINLESTAREAQELRATVEELQEELIQTKAEMESLQNQCKEKDNDISQKQSEINILETSKAETKTKFNELYNNIINLMNQWDIDSSDLVEGMQKLHSLKEGTQKEIGHYKVLLKETNIHLEEVKDQIITNESIFEKSIAELNSKISKLNNEIDLLRSQELNSFQEIADLKEELSYATNRYAEALQKEKDLKLESETEKTSLQENIHDLLAKYNKLSAEHTKTLEEYEKVKVYSEKVKNAKENLEVEIVQQKKKFEEDFCSTAEQYCIELNELKSKEAKALNSVERLKEELEREQFNRKRLSDDLNKATEELNEATNEHTSLLSKIEVAVQINQRFEEMYDTLKIEHENYLKESASTLLETKNELCQKINHLKNKCDAYESNIEELKKEKKDISEELVKSKELFENEISKKDSEIIMHVESITDLKAKLNLVTEEQKIIKEQVSKDLLAYNELSKICCEKNMKASELENKVAQLQCGNIVLETEKTQLEKMYEEKCKDYKKLEDLLNVEKSQYKDGTKFLKEEIASLEKSIVSKELKLDSCQKEICQLKEELETVNKVIKCLNEESNKNKEYVTQLGVIEEDLNKKLRQSLDDFNSTKQKYEDLNQKHIELLKKYKDIQEECSQQSKDRESLRQEIESKSMKMSELTTKYESIKSLLENDNSKMISLQEELEAKLEQVETLYWEKRCDDIKLHELSQKLIQVTSERDDLLEKRVKLIEETENSLVRAHDNAINVKKDLISKLETHEKDLKQKAEIKTELENLILQEKKSREFFENQVLELTNEKHNCQLMNKKLKLYIEKLVNLTRESPLHIDDMEEIEEAIQATESRITDILNKTKELNETINSLEKDRREINDKLKSLEKCNDELMKEKEKLSGNYEILCSEKINISQEKDKETKCLQNLKVQYDLLKEKFASIEDNKVDVKLEELKQKSEKKYEDYQKFLAECSLVKKQIDNIVVNRNTLEKIIIELKDNHISLQIKSAFISEDQHKLHFQQKHALEVIIDDIQKQFNRVTKLAYNCSLRTCQIFEKTVTGILTEKPIEWRRQLMDLNVPDVFEKLEELKDNANNTLQQLKTFASSLVNLNVKDDYKKNILKENVSTQKSTQGKEEEWIKKYKDVKQRLILMENSKNNFEKKVRQLREEIKNLNEVNNSTDNDIQYKKLLQDYIRGKENYETITRQLSQTESICKDIKSELNNIRTAYSNLKSDYAKLDQENVMMKRQINSRSEELGQLQSIKDAYEKLFEEHNKVSSEVDTLKYKRLRDREEYSRLLKQSNTSEVDKKVQNIKTEYELKMEKMKNRMMELYKTEMEREMEKLATIKNEKANLLKTIDNLKDEIRKLNLKLSQFCPPQRTEDFSTLDLDFPVRRETICSADFFKERKCNEARGDVFNRAEDRRYSTLPRNVDFHEEVRKNPGGTSAAVARLEMEDEEELFNNKYLREMKEGITNMQEGNRESTSSRLSVLAYRNSLCPPHLKSSYPAETQFLNPSRFKDEDIKVGNVDLNDSMSARLLPHEKPKKKDIGTTSYKKPGPPTPSKNGGRASLQGNEQNILREHNENVPKKLTPSRLRALFSRSKSGSEVGTENVLVYISDGCKCPCHKKITNSCKFCAALINGGDDYACCFFRFVVSSFWSIAKKTIVVFSILAATIYANPVSPKGKRLSIFKKPR